MGAVWMFVLWKVDISTAMQTATAAKAWMGISKAHWVRFCMPSVFKSAQRYLMPHAIWTKCLGWGAMDKSKGDGERIRRRRLWF